MPTDMSRGNMGWFYLTSKQNKKMVDIVEIALREYLSAYKQSVGFGPIN
ncbi:hypothetical protein [Paenibacillus sp. V4I5]|nr:hypothetical protein [Paenibacillus sp. V4I5]MDQ0914722.1 hypothetical protein [Paenibacillus sp. V4I5]